MRLVNVSVKRPVMITILVGVLLILGYVSFNSLAVDLYPEMKFPVGAVITNYSGAGPEEVESQISQPLESVLGTVANVKEVSSIHWPACRRLLSSSTGGPTWTSLLWTCAKRSP